MSSPSPNRIQGPDARRKLLSSKLSLLDALGSVQKYPRDVELCQQGSTAKNVFVLEAGMMALLHVGAYGQQSIVGLRQEPWIVGAHCLLTQQQFPVSVVTISPCTVRMIPSAQFLEKWEHDREFSWTVQELHCWDLQEHIHHCIGLTSESLRERLEEFIWELAKTDQKPNCRVKLPLNRTQLSQLLDISLPHLHTLL